VNDGSADAVMGTPQGLQSPHTHSDAGRTFMQIVEAPFSIRELARPGSSNDFVSSPDVSTLSSPDKSELMLKIKYFREFFIKLVDSRSGFNEALSLTNGTLI